MILFEIPVKFRGHDTVYGSNHRVNSIVSPELTELCPELTPELNVHMSPQSLKLFLREPWFYS